MQRMEPTVGEVNAKSTRSQREVNAKSTNKQWQTTPDSTDIEHPLTLARPCCRSLPLRC